MPTTLKKLVRARMDKTGETYQQALRHVRAEDGSRREGPQIILRHVGRRPLPWVPDQDDQALLVARMAADRQRRNIAAILAQQGDQVLPPLPTVGQLSGRADFKVRLEGELSIAEEVSTLIPPRVELVGIGALLSAQLAADPEMLHKISSAHYQEFICDRLVAMGQEVQLVGSVFQKDGGIDIVFWPKSRSVLPFLGAVQAKHHKDRSKKEGPGSVRDFAGAIAGHPFGAAILATNTAFTADAKWFAQEHARLIRLRDFDDMKRWIVNDFSNREERREMPESIELCPGVIVKIPS